MEKKMKEEMKKMNKKEKCVLCGKKTKYLRSTPIDKRKFFVEGCGQLCDDCGRVMGVE
jgi:ribosomal protein S14